MAAAFAVTGRREEVVLQRGEQRASSIPHRRDDPRTFGTAARADELDPETHRCKSTTASLCRGAIELDRFAYAESGTGVRCLSPRCPVVMGQRTTPTPVAAGVTVGPVAYASGPLAFGERSTVTPANFSDAPTLSATMSRVSRVCPVSLSV